jgi:hypothetical protein
MVPAVSSMHTQPGSAPPTANGMADQREAAMAAAASKRPTHQGASVASTTAPMIAARAAPKVPAPASLLHRERGTYPSPKEEATRACTRWRVVAG